MDETQLELIIEENIISMIEEKKIESLIDENVLEEFFGLEKEFSFSSIATIDTMFSGKKRPRK